MSPLQHLTPRFVFRVARIVIPVLLLAVTAVLFIWELHIELTPYPREWIQREIIPVKPLHGCFDNPSPEYNVSERLYGTRHTEVQAGFSMRLGMDCYDFAGTIRPPIELDATRPRTTFHTYWRTDLAVFGERQEWMLKSFLATQPVEHSRLVMWSNGDLSVNPTLQRYVDRYPGVFELRVADLDKMARGTALEGSKFLSMNDKRAWLDGDIVRLLAIWNEGGAWVDMDTLWTRDFTPLLEHEFVTQWDCYDKVYQTLNGAVMHFHKHSPYLCEAFHIIETSDAPRPGSTDWGALLYLKLWRRLVAAGVSPFKVLPFCFTDGRSCRLDNRLPDPFISDPKSGGWTGGLTRAEGGGLDERLKNVFAVHLHNQWEKEFPKGGWVRRLLLDRYEEALKRLGLKIDDEA
ncbi:glycosyltransferase family 32 protein [Amylostereum chailletii]|nr:glycosyltransferase family 32 protein [Amylostereum chailletii]